jgi:alpha-1,2-mannosyltransferase
MTGRGRLRSAIGGSWLDRKRIRAAGVILLVLQLAGFLFIVAGTHGWIMPLEKPTTTDFVSFYAAGALADAGTPALAYDHDAHLAAEERITGAGIEYQFFNYPPVYILLCIALAALPYLVAFIVFEAVSLAFYLLIVRRILGDRSGTAIVVLLAFPIVYWNFGLGQNAFLTAALFGSATVLIDRRPAVAGLLFGTLCYKPQFALLVPLALAAAGQWRAFVAAGISATALVLLSLALFGADTWQAFLQNAATSPAMYGSGRILFAGMANVFGAAHLLGAGVTLSYALQAAASLAAAAVVVIVWRRNLSLPTRAAILAAASLVAAPLSLLYDLMLGTVAAAWLIRDRDAPAAASWETTALAALYLMVLDGRGLAERWHVPAFPLAALALFAIAAARAWRETARRDLPADGQRSSTSSGLLAREQQISM